MRKHNVGEHITRITKSLYEDAKTKALIGDQFSERFKTSVGVIQGCFLSPTLFNLFLEGIMIEAIDDLNEWKS